MMQATHRTAPMTWLIGILMLAALACPGIGFAQSGSTLPPHGFANSSDPAVRHWRDGGRLRGPIQRPGDDGPVRPVPEPGTMALVGMGVVAIGAAVRKHRNR